METWHSASGVAFGPDGKQRCERGLFWGNVFLILLGCENLRNLKGFSHLMGEPEPAGFGDHQPLQHQRSHELANNMLHSIKNVGNISDTLDMLDHSTRRGSEHSSKTSPSFCRVISASNCLLGFRFSFFHFNCGAQEGEIMEAKINGTLRDELRAGSPPSQWFVSENVLCEDKNKEKYVVKKSIKVGFNILRHSQTCLYLSLQRYFHIYVYTSAWLVAQRSPFGFILFQYLTEIFFLSWMLTQYEELINF